MFNESTGNQNKQAPWQLKRERKLGIHWYLCHTEQLTVLQHGKKKNTRNCNWQADSLAER